jgi:hypothetical protein
VLDDPDRAWGLADQGAGLLGAQSAHHPEQQYLGVTRWQAGKELGDGGIGDPDVL